MTKYTKEITIAKLGFPVLLIAIIAFLNLLDFIISFLENHVAVIIILFCVGFVIIGIWIIRGTKEYFDKEEEEKKNSQKSQ